MSSHTPTIKPCLRAINVVGKIYKRIPIVNFVVLLKLQVAESHANNRDSRVVWLGNSDHVLSSGLGANRERQVALRDIRNLSSPLKEYNGDSSLGIYLPLYDTGMLW